MPRCAPSWSAVRRQRRRATTISPKKLLEDCSTAGQQNDIRIMDATVAFWMFPIVQSFGHFVITKRDQLAGWLGYKGAARAQRTTTTLDDRKVIVKCKQ